MPVRSVSRSPTAAHRATRFVLAFLLALLAAAEATTQPPEKKAPESKSSVGVKLPDGTYLWTGKPGSGDRVDVSAEEWRKLLDQLDQLKKQATIRKPVPPTECRLRVRVEKRGELSVAAVKASFEFQTLSPRTAVTLGGKRAFPASATLDGNKLAVLDTSEDGLIALIESIGRHTLVLDLEAPVTARNGKGEVGFELGLPRAAITKLILDAPPADVKKINLTTRTPDAATPTKAPPALRETGIDVKSFADGPDGGRALGAIESLEVTWDPPATAAPATDTVRTAEWDIQFHLADTTLDTTARLRLNGITREWRFLAPANATVSVDRVSNANTSTSASGSDSPPTVTKPTDASKSVWKIDFGSGSPADWAITMETHQTRPKSEARRSVPVGPFTALDVFRQTGSVKVAAGPHMRFLFKHGPNLRQVESPTPGEDEGTVAFFRLSTGPVPAQAQAAALFEVDARPLSGRLLVRPAYRLKLTEGGWRVNLEARVTPAVRSEVDQVTIEWPAGWPTPEPADAIVDTVQLQKGDGPRSPLVVRFDSGRREPFDFALTATIPIADSTRGNATLMFPRFTQSPESETPVKLEVPAGKEVRASAHEWEADQPSGWSHALTPLAGADGKPMKPVMAVAGKLEQGLASVDVAWQPHRPELIAEMRADVDIQDRQILVDAELRLRSPDGFPRQLSFHGPSGAVPVPKKAFPFATAPLGVSEWDLTLPTSEPGKDGTSGLIRFAYAVPIPARSAGMDDRVPRKMPIGLFWPTAMTRAEATVRVWPAVGGGPVTLVPTTDEWRTFPPEAVAERSVLPALTLFTGGTEPSLTLEIRPAGTNGLSSGQIERCVVEAWGGDDGTPARRRGLFLVRRWFHSSLDIELPGLLAGHTAEAFVNGKQASGAHPTNEPSILRVPITSDADRNGFFTVEVRYQTAGSRGAWTSAALLPPRVRSATYFGPTRWLIALPGSATPLLFDDTCQVEQRWRIPGWLPQPTAAYGSADLEHWFHQGIDADDNSEDGAPAISGEHLTFRQESPAPISVVRVPRGAFLAGCSLLAFAIGLMLSRMSGPMAGLLGLLLAGGIAAAAVAIPQPAAQAASAALPGVIALTAVLVGQAVWRWQQRRRMTYLPGFTRTRIDPLTGSVLLPVPASPSARNGPSKASTGTAQPMVDTGSKTGGH